MLIEKIKDYTLVSIKDKQNPFYGISDENMKDLLYAYYTDELSVKQVIKKYNLSIKNISRFASYLPSYYVSEKCPYDNCKMVTQLPSKSSLKSSKPDFICEKCNHIEYSVLKKYRKCNCDNCNNKKKEEHTKLKKLISSIYEGTVVDLLEISILDRINLAAILQASGTELGYLIPPFNQYATSKTSVKLAMVRDLCEKKILKISTQNPMKIFSNISDNGFDYSLQETWLSINVEDEKSENENSLFEELKYPKTFTDISIKEYINLWKKCISEELLKLFVFQMKRLNFDKELADDKKIEKFLDAIGRWTETYTPSQIYHILYVSVRKANDIRTAGNMGNYCFNEISFVIKLADQMILKYETEGWPIQHYNYPDHFEIDIQTKLFFSKIAKTHNWFDTKIPKWEQISFEDIDEKLTITKAYSEYIQEIEIKKIDPFLDKMIENAIYYYLFPYGLIIFDGFIECLFSTSKDLYEYFQLLKESGQIDKIEENFEDTISSSTNLYVGKSYSSSTIYQAIDILIENDIPRKSSIINKLDPKDTIS
ncbi:MULTISPECIES: hypothetical protein [Enterococcus]|uniref:hypothetical protein n=1 Tax=Enterococcus TaxID=1350 RepID=UPI0004475F8C|nr:MULTISPECIES: hypothetical protein [Enterococcus]EYT94555.1 hypothetical protein AK89_13085 [Enterococcus mundtii CRL35]